MCPLPPQKAGLAPHARFGRIRGELRVTSGCLRQDAATWTPYVSRCCVKCSPGPSGWGRPGGSPGCCAVRWSRTAAVCCWSGRRSTSRGIWRPIWWTRRPGRAHRSWPPLSYGMRRGLRIRPIWRSASDGWRRRGGGDAAGRVSGGPGRPVSGAGARRPPGRCDGPRPRRRRRRPGGDGPRVPRRTARPGSRSRHGPAPGERGGGRERPADPTSAPPLPGPALPPDGPADGAAAGAVVEARGKGGGAEIRLLPPATPSDHDPS